MYDHRLILRNTFSRSLPVSDMNRRRFLIGGGTVLTAANGGCLHSPDLLGADDSDEWSPDLIVPDVELEQGTHTTVDLAAENVAGLTVGSTGHTEQLSFEFSEVTIDPSPATVFTMRPPTWVWKERTSVTVALPVSATVDAQPGTYDIAVTMYDVFPDEPIEIPSEDERDGSGWTSKTGSFSITVR